MTNGNKYWWCTMSNGTNTDITKANLFLWKDSNARPIADIIPGAGYTLAHDPAINGGFQHDIAQYMKVDYSHGKGAPKTLEVRHHAQPYISGVRDACQGTFDTLGLPNLDDLISVFHVGGKPPLNADEYLALFDKFRGAGWDVLVTSGHGDYAASLMSARTIASPTIAEFLQGSGFYAPSR